MDKIGYVVSCVMSDGVGSTCRRIVRYGVRHLFEVRTTLTFYRKLKHGMVTSHEPGGPHCQVLAAPEAWDALALVEHPDMRRQWRRTVSIGDMCAVGRVRGRDYIATFLWISPGKELPDWLGAVRHGSKGAYLYAVYTVRDMRGRGLARTNIEFACQHLREAGYDHVWLQVDAQNERALRCCRSTGFVEVGRERCLSALRVGIGRQTCVLGCQ